MAGVVTFAALAMLMGVKHVPVGRFTGDFVGILDGGYRISQGEWPHIDFAVPFGAWPLVQGWVALRLAPWFAPFVTYQVTQWLTVLPAAIFVAAIQQTRWRTFSVLGIVAVMTLVPYVMDGRNTAGFSYYAGYNRLTAALLFLGFIWSLTPRRVAWRDAIFLVFVLFALLATKITGFVVCLGVLAATAAFSSVKRILVLRACFLLAVALGLLQLGTGLPSAYLGDIRAMLAINRGGIVYFAASLTLRSLPGVLATIALIGAVMPQPTVTAWRETARTAFCRPIALLRYLRAPVMITTVLAGTIAAESQNTGTLLLAATTAVLFWPLPCRRSSPLFLSGCRIAVAVVILGPWFGGDLYRGLIVATREAPHMVSERALSDMVPGVRTPLVTAAAASDLIRLWRQPDPPVSLFADANSAEPAFFVALARTVEHAAVEARRLRLVNSTSRVISLSNVDLFARVLGARSPVGTTLWLAPGRTVGTLSNDEVHAYLRNVDAVFMGRCDEDDVYMRLNKMFMPELERSFSRHDLTACWSVWLHNRQPS